ncbi:MAG: zinc ABC transporter substrate-binding protein [Thermoprotei archaeon]
MIFTRKLLALLILVQLIIMIVPETSTFSENTGVYVIVTFSNLVPDILQLLCPYDKIDYIAPPGVDPHTYTLKPSDIEKLRRVDIVISTGHTPFEYRIRELRERGVFNAILIEIPHIPGIVLKENPVTHTINYHMPIYDPYNYIAFIEHIAKELSHINPSCSTVYMERASSVVERVQSIIKETPHINATAIADHPFVQYAIEWIGIEIVYLIAQEHEISGSPKLESIDKLLSEKTIKYAVITDPPKTSYSQWLLAKAEEYNIPIIRVKSPLLNMSTIEKLLYVVAQINSIKLVSETNPLGETIVANNYLSRVLSTSSLIIGFILLTVTAIMVMRRE